MKSSKSAEWFSPYLLCLLVMILAAAMWRLIDHPWNFAPVAAIALFGGAYLPKRGWALAAPIGAMFLSDIILYAQKYSSYWDTFIQSQSLVYVSMAMIVGLGFWLRERRNVLNIAAGTLAGAMLFFVITNFGAWLTVPAYSKDFSGLISCYVAAIPFFRNQLAGDVCFSAVLFGGFALAQRYVTVLRPENEKVAVEK